MCEKVGSAHPVCGVQTERGEKCCTVQNCVKFCQKIGGVIFIRNFAHPNITIAQNLIILYIPTKGHYIT